MGASRSCGLTSLIAVGRAIDRDENSKAIPSCSQDNEFYKNHIKELRDKWMMFSEDQTRVNSMRIMASQFSRELTEILSK